MAIFKRKLLDKILDESKVQTRRVGKRTWKIGRAYGVRNSRFTKIEAKILILRRFKQRLNEISQEDAKKEGFQTREQFFEAWKEIYGSLNPDQVVTAYEFKLTK